MLAGMDVRLDWYGCATFRLTVGGQVVFLDAYVDRVPGAAGPGVAAEDIDRADWILVGHSHFDHLWGAERIAVRTGATVVGSYETVRVMAERVVPERQLLAVSGGERVRLGDGVIAEVYPSLHSCVWSRQPFPDPGEVCLGELGVTHQERLARYGEFAAGLGQRLAASAALEHLRASDQHTRGDGGTLVYLIRTPAGSLLYQDTAGHWSGVLRGLRSDVAILAAAGRANLDGEPVQGTLADFVAAEAAALAPRALILCHHDDWLPGFTRPVDIAPIRSALAEQAPHTRLAELGYVDGHPIFD
jgi:L-ascorbate metabolism protein UlaG (beta-lactamase superfamily)